MHKIQDLVNFFRSNPKKLTEFYNNLFQKVELFKKYNFFTKIYRNEVLKKIKDPIFYKKYKSKPLFGIPFFLKDVFAVKGKETSAGSQILKNYIPNFNSTVYEILTNNGGILIGKTVLDELSMGGTGLESFSGYTRNSLNSDHIVGGSSSGSALAVSLKITPFSLGSDTGDSVRKPASYLGVIGFKPTFGLISRLGLIPFSPSLDTIGIFANDIEDLKIVSSLLFYFDKKDFVLQNNTDSLKKTDLVRKKTKVLILKAPEEFVSQKNWKFFLNKTVYPLIKKGYEVDYLSLPDEIINNLLLAYQIISFSESLSSQANLTGINFGFLSSKQKELNFYEIIKTQRLLSFKKEIKRRYVLGSFFTYKENQDKFYWKALRFRNYLNDYFNNLFKKFDFIMHLSSFDTAPLIKDVEESKKKRMLKPLIDDFLLIANFLGLPSINLPLATKGDLPVGFNVFTQPNQDYLLLDFAKVLIAVVNFKKNKII